MIVVKSKGSLIRYKVVLTKVERTELEFLISEGSHRVSKVNDAMILLNCAVEGNSPKCFNKVTSIITLESMRTIETVNKKFDEEGLYAVMHSGESKRIDAMKCFGKTEAHFVLLCCHEAPAGFLEWSLPVLAVNMVELVYVDGITHVSVNQLQNKEEKNHRKPSDEQFFPNKAARLWFTF